MNFKVNVNHLKKQLEKFKIGFEEAASKGLTDIATQGAKIAQTQHEYKSHGGNGLEANTVPYKNSALEQGIIANKYYASWVEYGNGAPGTRIYPVSTKVLRFFIDGEEVFAKSVAASNPKPFMANAVRFVNNMGTKIMSQHINNFIKGL